MWEECYLLGQANDGRLSASASANHGVRPDSDRHVKELINTGLHELGHLYGLDHHGPKETINGLYCPMEEDLCPDEDANSFCSSCSSELGVDERRVTETLDNPPIVSKHSVGMMASLLLERT